MPLARLACIQVPKGRLSFASSRDQAHFERPLLSNMEDMDRTNPKNNLTRGRYEVGGVDLVLRVEDR
jgi:hypothetical protein